MPIRIGGMRLGKEVEPQLGERLETLPLPDTSPERRATPLASVPDGPVMTPNQRRFGDNYDPETDSYRHGKNRAPEHGKIKPGEVRNPRGRPKGSRNRSTLLREAMDTKVTATIGGRQRRISRLELSYLGLSAKAAKGDLKAIELAEKLMDKLIGSEANDDVAEPPLTEAELAILERRHAERG